MSDAGQAFSPDVFEAIWSAYPSSAGSNEVATARELTARMRQGCTLGEFLDGAKRYYAYCEVTGRLEARYVMTAQRFFGPDLNFTKDWARPLTKSEKVARETQERLEAEDAQRPATKPTCEHPNVLANERRCLQCGERV